MPEDGAPWQLIFQLPSPRDHDHVTYDATGWTSLSASQYPFLIGGLYIVSEGYTAAGIARL